MLAAMEACLEQIVVSDVVDTCLPVFYLTEDLVPIPPVREIE